MSATQHTAFEFVQRINELKDHIVIDISTGTVVDAGNLVIAPAAPTQREQTAIEISVTQARRYALAYGQDLYVIVDGPPHALTNAELLSDEETSLARGGSVAISIDANIVAMRPSPYNHENALIEYLQYDDLTGHQRGDSLIVCGAIVNNLVCGLGEHDSKHAHGYWIGEKK